MEWERYAAHFRAAALDHGLGDDYIRECLEYAERIHKRGIVVVYDLQHLALLVGYDLYYVLGAAYDGASFYRTFSIPKKAGGLREIREPLPSLKEIQRWILDNVLNRLQPTRYAKGFVIGRSIKDNARFHHAQRRVLSLDIKEFFPSIARRRVYALYRSLGYGQAVSNILARLCTLDESLPQGAPTSPAISNLVFASADKRLGGFAHGLGLRYTRYADDITFSGDRLDPGRVIRFTRHVLASLGLSLNEEKTRLMQRHQQQEVTGIVVNQTSHAPRSVRRQLRQCVYFIKKFGLNDHIRNIGETHANYLRRMMGIANFVLFIDPSDRDAQEAMTVFRDIVSAEVAGPDGLM